MTHPQLSSVVSQVQGSLEHAIDRLSGFLRIPAVSCDPAHAADVRRLAEHIRDDLQKAGFDNARVLDVERRDGDAMAPHPCVAAEWLKAGADKPTVHVFG
ncbi:MAG: M20 family dipeptidase, partial [Deltaproteobacteria bacterium]|nr:M20 family dipeptidase [Deltaproteobacteria bacterium]